MNHEDRTDPIMHRARRLPREVPPARDLWPGIRARIDEDRRTGAGPTRWNTWVPAALAASVVVAVGIVALLRASGPDEPAGPVGAGTTVAATPASFGPSFTLGPQYEDARASLADDLDERLASLPPETREVVNRNLAAIRQALDEINVALEADPGNPLLQRLLMDAYHDELAVLANMRRLTETLSTPQRNEI